MPGAALKEITERLGKISEWLRVGIPVDVCQPGKLLVFDSVEPARRFSSDALALAPANRTQNELIGPRGPQLEWQPLLQPHRVH